MSSVGLNKCIISGYLAADAQIKTVDLRSGETAQLATTTLYVRRQRDRKESFTVKLTIWQRSSAWRLLPYLKKGSVVICTGNIEPNPYISSTDNAPRAGLEMTVIDIDLDRVRNGDEEAIAEAKPSEDSAEDTRKDAEQDSATADPILGDLDIQACEAAENPFAMAV